MSTLTGCLRLGRFLVDNTLYANSRRGMHGAGGMVPRMRRFSSVSEERKTTEGSQQAPPDGAAAAPQETNPQLDELNKTLEEVKKMNDELNDKYKRSLADSENMRKRFMKQVEEAKMFGIHNFCKDLLEVADILGKATECVPKDEIKDSNPHLKNLYEGLTMTEAQLIKVFKRHGLEPVNPIDEKFDPNMHEALFQQEVEGKAAGTVVVVSKIGYKLHNRIIRPALVGVAKA